MKRFLGAAATLLLLGYLLSGLYRVGTDEEAVVRVCGKITHARVQPGMHYTFPYPFAMVEKLKTREWKRVMIGWTMENQALSQSNKAGYSQVLTGDKNIINVHLVVSYTIADPALYLFHTEDADGMVKGYAQAALTHSVAGHGVDQLLTTEKPLILEEIKQALQDNLGKLRAGIHISAINFGRVYPPSQVEESFQKVVSASAMKEEIIHVAEGEAQAAIAKANGQAYAIIRQAEARANARILQADGDSLRFLSLLQEYRQAKTLTAKRLYLETMESVLPGLRKYIIDGRTSRSNISLYEIQPDAEPSR